MLGIRLEAELDRRLTTVARQTGRSKSELVREALRRFLNGNDLISEARRQSLLVAGRMDNQDIDTFIDEVSDQDGWS
jgi:predicted transcriptional regulator